MSTNISPVIIEALIEVNMKITGFWDVML